MRTVSHRLIENDQNEKLYLCFTIWQQLVNTVYMSQNNRASNINAAGVPDLRITDRYKINYINPAII